MSFKENDTSIIKLSDNTKTLVRIWTPTKPPKAIFLALHGAFAHCGDFVTSALYFKEKGFSIYAFDQRGHGTYPQYNPSKKLGMHVNSFQEFVDDALLVLRWVKQENPDVPIFILGHSMGALISLMLGLTLVKDDQTDVKGFILSSPWLKNKVKLPRLLMAISKFLSVVYPTFSAEVKTFLEDLTHDPDIVQRHKEDETNKLRGNRGTARSAVAFQKAQKWTSQNLSQWNLFPLFVVLAGQDKIAVTEFSEEVLSTIPKKLIKIVKYDENYHENFNELNRELIYDQILDWINTLD